MALGFRLWLRACSGSTWEARSVFSKESVYTKKALCTENVFLALACCCFMLLRLLDTPNLVMVDGTEDCFLWWWRRRRRQSAWKTRRGRGCHGRQPAPGRRRQGARKKSGAAIQHIRGVGDGFDTFTNFPLVSLFLFVVFYGAERVAEACSGAGAPRSRDTEPERC